MIAWRGPAEELPEPGAVIWILDQDVKRNGALSCAIVGAVVRHVKTEFSDLVLAENNNAACWRTWVLKDHKGQAKKEDHAAAWCPLEEIDLPAFIEHRRKSS